ncbi:hypothetical protein TRAPUB_4503 [Trametes pubescens]|uniref:Uncharacterized protein n=1 Tax=Trametes pubescens TaxID=154538 RepID=A0A1M2VAW0_TRAPU|nr:hypothetical protein TRAPUB_4503 [Trametes pubescens]
MTGMCTYVGTLATFHMVFAGCQAGPLLVNGVKKRVQHVGAFASCLPQLRAQSHTVPSRVPVVIPIRYSSKSAGADVVKVQVIRYIDRLSIKQDYYIISRRVPCDAGPSEAVLAVRSR